MELIFAELGKIDLAGFAHIWAITVNNDAQITLDEIIAMLPPNAHYIICTIPNMGTDIQSYFMMLNYLESTGLDIIYLIKCHTKSDTEYVTNTTKCYAGPNLKNIMNIMYSPENINAFDVAGFKEYVMPNNHVHEILEPLFRCENYKSLAFVAGSSFISRYNYQLEVLNTYGELIKYAMLSTQYYSGYVFEKNSPAHALERIIGGFQNKGKLIGTIG